MDCARADLRRFETFSRRERRKVGEGNALDGGERFERTSGERETRGNRTSAFEMEAETVAQRQNKGEKL